MNYVVESYEKGYYVKEVQTNQVIAVYGEMCNARKMANHLNSGAAFDGWTPNFFLI